MSEVYVFFYLSFKDVHIIDEFKFNYERLINTIEQTTHLNHPQRKTNLLASLFINMAYCGEEIYRSAIINYLAMWNNVQKYMDDHPHQTFIICVQIIDEKIEVLPLPFEGFTEFRNAWYSQVPDEKPQLLEKEEPRFPHLLN